MKKSVKYTGTAVDILMYAIMLVQMVYVFTGNVIHELLGAGFFLCLIIHLVIKRKYLLTMPKWRKKPAEKKFSDAVIILLVLAAAALMVSSMDVSRTLLPQVSIIGSAGLHTYLATAVLALSVLHGGMHGYARTKKKKRAALFIALGCVAAIAVGLALVPYLDRHCRIVRIDYDAAVSGHKVELHGQKPLVVYFTRLGNTDFNDDADAVSGASLLLADGELMGSDQLIADMISNAVDCDVRAITLTGEKYPSGYGDTVSAAGKELRKNARPPIEDIDVSGYDKIILVYPLWWGRVPMPVATFLEGADFSGKDIYLIATQGSSGYGSSVEDVRKMAAGAEVHKVMSIYCDDIPYSRERIGSWLKELAEE